MDSLVYILANIPEAIWRIFIPVITAPICYYIFWPKNIPFSRLAEKNLKLKKIEWILLILFIAVPMAFNAFIVPVLYNHVVTKYLVNTLETHNEFQEKFVQHPEAKIEMEDGIYGILQSRATNEQKTADIKQLRQTIIDT